MHIFFKTAFLSAIFFINYASAIPEDSKLINNFVGSARDSYMNAYRTTQVLNSNSKSGKVTRDADYQYPFGTADEYNSAPVFYQQQSHEYGPPKPEYGHPKPEYGPPKPEYGPPKPEYGPPIKDFGSTNHIYGSPPSYYHYLQPVQENSYGTPYSMFLPGLLDKLKFKLNLFTIGKIILKLVIFKKIVSLLGILCLLMFIPTLKHIKEKEPEHEDDNDDGGLMMRSLADKTDKKVNTITAHILDSIDLFTNKYEHENKTSNILKKCDSVSCKSRVFLKHLDKKYSYKKLANAYLEEEAEKSM